jgi:hypothetical protein
MHAFLILSLEGFNCWHSFPGNITRGKEIGSISEVSVFILNRIKENRNIIHTIKRRKANYIGHILCRNSLLKHIIEGKIETEIEVTGRQGRGQKRLLDGLKEK